MKEKRNIKALIISLINNADATYATRRLIRSIRDTKSAITPLILDATTPQTIEQDLQSILYLGSPKTLPYTWPTFDHQNGLDLRTGLYRKAYQANDVNKVVACMVSHMRTWQLCIEMNEPIMVLEQDALFVRRFSWSSLLDPQPLELDDEWYERWSETKELKVMDSAMEEEDKRKFLSSAVSQQPQGEFTAGILGLNSPIGATRRAGVFHKELFGKYGFHSVPKVNEVGEEPVPQGIAGNSAYIIKPWMAKKLLDKVREIGMWPNDALMCRELFPSMQVCWPYYTVVQGTKSTTTG